MGCQPQTQRERERESCDQSIVAWPSDGAESWGHLGPDISISGKNGSGMQLVKVLCFSRANLAVLDYSVCHLLAHVCFIWRGLIYPRVVRRDVSVVFCGGGRCACVTIRPQSPVLCPHRCALVFCKLAHSLLTTTEQASDTTQCRQ